MNLHQAVQTIYKSLQGFGIGFCERRLIPERHVEKDVRWKLVLARFYREHYERIDCRTQVRLCTVILQLTL